MVAKGVDVLSGQNALKNVSNNLKDNRSSGGQKIGRKGNGGETLKFGHTRQADFKGTLNSLPRNLLISKEKGIRDYLILRGQKKIRI